MSWTYHPDRQGGRGWIEDTASQAVAYLDRTVANHVHPDHAAVLCNARELKATLREVVDGTFGFLMDQEDLVAWRPILHRALELLKRLEEPAEAL